MASELSSGNCILLSWLLQFTYSRQDNSYGVFRGQREAIQGSDDGIQKRGLKTPLLSEMLLPITHRIHGDRQVKSWENLGLFHGSTLYGAYRWTIDSRCSLPDLIICGVVYRSISRLPNLAKTAFVGEASRPSGIFPAETSQAFGRAVALKTSREKDLTASLRSFPAARRQKAVPSLEILRSVVCAS